MRIKNKFIYLLIRNWGYFYQHAGANLSEAGIHVLAVPSDGFFSHLIIINNNDF